MWKNINWILKKIKCFSPMLGTVQFSSLAGGGWVAGPGGGLKQVRHHCEQTFKKVSHPGGRAPGGGPLGKKGSTNSPNSGIWVKRWSANMAFAVSPTPKLSSAHQREEENPLQASPQISFEKMVSFDSKACIKCKRTYFFIAAMSAAEKLFSCLLGGLLLDWTWPPCSVSRS